MHGLAALRPSDRTRQRILAGYARLPFFGDCPPWNVCAAGGSLAWCDSDWRGGAVADTMGKEASAGCARLDFGMKYQANAACCVDLLLAQVTESVSGRGDCACMIRRERTERLRRRKNKRARVPRALATWPARPHSPGARTI